MRNNQNGHGDYFTIVSKVFMRNGTYPLMFIGRVYNTYKTT